MQRLVELFRFRDWGVETSFIHFGFQGILTVENVHEPSLISRRGSAVGLHHHTYNKVAPFARKGGFLFPERWLFQTGTVALFGRTMHNVATDATRGEWSARGA